MQSPLPVRDGVNATRLRLPDEGPWTTAMDYMMHRWGHIDPQGIEDRFDAGEIVGEGGIPLDRATKLEDHTFIWYYRTLPPETRIPVDISILHQDEHLLVVDKPHFLPTTPGGTYIQESALVRLRNQLDLPDLIPMHRLDRMTAGVLLLSTNPETRGKYQVLFEKRQVQKEYECVSAAEPAAGYPAVDFPVVVRNRMTKSRSYLLAEVIDGEPNAETRIERLETFDGGASDAAGAPATGIQARTAWRATGWSRTPEKRTSCGCTWPRWAWASSTTPFIPTCWTRLRTTTPSRCSCWPAASGSWTPSASSPWSTAAGWNSARLFKHGALKRPPPSRG